MRQVLTLLVPLGALTRWAFGGALGFGFFAWVLGLIAAFAWAAGREGRQQARGGMHWAIVAGFFALMVVLRDAAGLTFFNALATAGFLGLAARDVVWPVERTRLFDFSRSAFEATGGTFRGAAMLSSDALHGARELKERAPGSVGAVFRGLLFAAPVLCVLTALLMSGDAHFRDALGGTTSSLPDLMRTAADWGFWSVVLGLLAAGLLTFALRRRGQPPELPRVWSGWQVGAIEGLVVLGSVVGLFATFLSVQAAYLFSQDPSAPGNGLTYARYAREGFAELTVVAGLTWWLVESALRRVKTTRDTAVRVAGSMVLAQALVILVSAHVRLALYDEVYGFTVTRIYAHAGIAFLGLCLLARLVTLWAARRSTANLVAASGIAVLSALNVLNPDATVVRANLERPQDTVRIDWSYLSTLSADAAPALEPLFEAGLSRENDELSRWACRESPRSLAAWNLARASSKRFDVNCPLWQDKVEAFDVPDLH